MPTTGCERAPTAEPRYLAPPAAAGEATSGVVVRATAPRSAAIARETGRERRRPSSAPLLAERVTRRNLAAPRVRFSIGSPGRSLLDSVVMAARIPDKPGLEGLEERWSARWDAEGAYRFDRSQPRERVFSIDTPPPTVSGSLHVGHVFSYTHTDTHTDVATWACEGWFEFEYEFEYEYVYEYVYEYESVYV